MSAPRRAQAPESPSSLDVAVRNLLDQLAAETARAGTMATTGDTDSLHEVLDARDTMLAALEGVTRVLTPPQGMTALGVHTPEFARAELLAMATNLQRANVQLMRGVQRETDRLSASIAAIDRPDNVKSAYSGGARPELSVRLDLVR